MTRGQPPAPLPSRTLNSEKPPAPPDVRTLLLTDLLSRQAPLAIINMGVAGLAACVFVGHVAAWIVGSWLGYVAAAQGFRLYVARGLAQGRFRVGQRIAGRLLVLNSALAGIGWGAVSLLFYQPGRGTEEVFVPFILAGMAAGTVGSLSAYVPAIYVFLLLSLSPYAARLMLTLDTTSVIMACATAAYGFGMAFLGRQTHRTMRQSAALHLQNTRLVARLEDARSDLERRVNERTDQWRETNRALLEEIEERRRKEARVRHLLAHDSLTNLPNRLLLVDRLEQALTEARLDGSRVAVALFDLDRFKTVNDTYGHLIGDALLAQLGERVRFALRASDTIARFGGDEFAVVATNLVDRAGPEALGRKLLAVCSEPFILGNRRVDVSVSIGIALFPDHGQDVNPLLSAADLALYAAKAGGRGRYCVLSAAMQTAARTRRQIEAELRLALERHQFRLVYQPRFTLGEGRRMVAVEALLRWQHPELGLMSPTEFIPVAEASGIIRDIGHWVLATACEDAAAWARAGHPLRVAVNLSAVEFRQPDLLQWVRDSLHAAMLDPALLELEITESAYLDRGLGAVDADLRRISQLGVRIAIDDFGTGYSSLAYLTWLPIDIIKIDRSFIATMENDRRTAAIVLTIVSLAKRLDKTVVAEGIEDVAQLQALQRLGCDEAQGFLLGHPLAADDIRRRLAGQAAVVVGTDVYS